MKNKFVLSSCPAGVCARRLRSCIRVPCLMRMCVCLCSCWWCLAFFFRAVVISHPYSKLFTVSRGRGSATSDVDRESLLERGRAIPTGRIFIAHATARPPTRSRVRTAANRRVAAMGGPCWLLKPNGQRLGAPDCTDNFQISKFEFRGTAYHSVEQAFQCLKFTPGSATSRQRRHIRGKARIHEVMACACGKRARAGRTS